MREISIAALLRDVGDRQTSTQLAGTSNPVAVTGITFFTTHPQLTMDFDAKRSGASAITGRAILRSANSVILETEFDLDILQRSLAIDADSTLYLNEILKLSGLTDLSSANIRLSDSLDLDTRVILDSPFDELAIRTLSLTLDSADALLQFVQQTDTARAELQLQLPLLISGESAALDRGFEFSASALQVSGSWSHQGIDIVAAPTFTILAPCCSSMLAFLPSIQLDSNITLW